MSARVRTVGSGVALASLVAVAGLATRVACRDTQLRAETKADAAIVLGAAAYHKTPSPVFAARLAFARDLLTAGRVRYAILTGGSKVDGALSEAEVGAAYLRARGIASSRLLLDRSSRTTFENLCNARALGAASGLRSYVVVSDPLHLTRALHLAEDIDLRVAPAATPYSRFRGASAWLGLLWRETYLYSGSLIFRRRQCPPRDLAPRRTEVSTPKPLAETTDASALPAHPAPPETPVQWAQHWMDALRSRHVVQLRLLTSYPFRFHDTGAVVNCKAGAAARAEELPEALACLFEDELLMGALNTNPELVFEQAQPRNLPRWARRWSRELRGPGAIVLTVIADNGISYFFALLVAEDGVRAVFRHAEFWPN